MNPIKKNTTRILGTLLVLALLAGFLVPAVPVSAGAGFSPITVWLGTSSVTVSTEDYNTLLATYNTTSTGIVAGKSYVYSGIPLYRIMEFAFPAIGTLNGYSVLTESGSPAYQVLVGPEASDNVPVKGNDTLIIAHTGTIDGVADTTRLPRLFGPAFSAGKYLNQSVDKLSLAYTIEVAAATNGVISPDGYTWNTGSTNPFNSTTNSGDVYVLYGGSRTFSLNPAAGYHVATITTDAGNQTPATTYTFSNVQANHSISATFAETTYSIQVNAGANGTITPAGTDGIVTVKEGESQTFNITAEEGYYVTNVIVDNVSLGAMSSYTFNNVTANHSITAYFVADFTLKIINAGNTYNLTQADFLNMPQVHLTVTTTNSAGTVSTDTYTGVPLYKLVALNDGDGDPASFNSTLAATGYNVKATALDNFINGLGPTYGITVAGNDKLIVANLKNEQPLSKPPLLIAGFVSMESGADSISTSKMVSKLVSLEIVYIISVAQGIHGKLTPLNNTAFKDKTSVPVSNGADQVFNISPDSGYQIDYITVDGVQMPAAASYTFTDVTANHTLAATFIPQHQITTATDGHGTAVATPAAVNSGDDSVITITPEEGYVLNRVSDNGTDVTDQVTGGIYTLTSITDDHNIVVTFRLVPAVKVSLLPVFKTVDAGATFNLTLNIETNTSIRAWQGNIDFDPAKLQAVQVTEGPFLKDWVAEQGEFTAQAASPILEIVQAVAPEIDNTNGHITNINYEIMGTVDLDGPVGKGILCIITFRAVNGVNDTTPVNPSSVIVSDVFGEALPNVTTAGNTVGIGVKGLGTTVSLKSSKSPAPLGQSVDLTATVKGTGTGVPGGKVTFLDDDMALGEVPLINGKATFTTDSLLIGSHPIVAVYSGDETFSYSSNTVPLVQVIAKGSPKVTAVGNPASSVYGQAVVFRAEFSLVSEGVTPTGTVQFTIDKKAFGSPVNLVNGEAATPEITNLTVGKHKIKAAYSGDSNYNAAVSAELSFTVQQSLSTAAVASSVASSVYGDTVAFTATVIAVDPGVGVPTGKITLLDGKKTLAQGVLDNGLATWNITSLTPGEHQITAKYSGDKSFKGVTSAAITQTVTKAAPAISIGSLPVDSAVLGQAITLTATMVSGVTGVKVTGKVTFMDGETALGKPVSLASGKAKLKTSKLAVGTHNIVAKYSGDAKFLTIDSSALALTINQATPALTFTVTPKSAVYGQPLVFSATLKGLTGFTPTGTVTFMDGDIPLGTPVTLAKSKAGYSTGTLLPGTHSLKAVYSGDTNYSGVTSAAQSRTISKAKTAIKLTSAVAGTAATLTAKVTAKSPSKGTPAGKVVFYNGAVEEINKLGEAVVNESGSAVLTHEFAVGTYSITALFDNEDGKFEDVTSSKLTLKIK